MSRSERSGEGGLPASEITARLADRFGDDVIDASEPSGQAAVTVTPERYVEVVRGLRDDPEFAFDYLDHVTGVDLGDEGLEVVAQLFSTTHRHQARVKVRCDRETPRCPSLVDVYPGANWHERETWELFGIVFEGHPQLVKLILPEEFEGHPLRKDFVLMTRVAKPWPGAEEGAEEEGE